MLHRSRPHAAFFVFPEFADTIPTLSIVTTLIRRGWRVSYVTTDRFSAELTVLGAEFLQCPSYREFSANPTDGPSGPEKQLSALTARTLAEVSPFYERNRPTVVVHDTVSVAGRILAKQWDIPAIQVSCDFRMDKRYRSRQAPEFFDAVFQTAASFRNVLATYGITGDGFCFSRSEMNIYFYPKLFQLDSDAVDENSFYAGRCAPERPYTDKWQPRKDDRPTVLVSSSSLFLQGPGYFNMCIDALVSQQWHVILNIGDNNVPDAFRDLPPQFELIRGRPLIAIMPYVDLLVCAGGMMTTVESIYCGVPMLTITYGNVELEAYAENGVRLGVGRHLMKEDANARTITNSLLEMFSDDELFSTVRQMRRLVRADPGAEEVANRIDDYVCAII